MEVLITHNSVDTYSSPRIEDTAVKVQPGKVFLVGAGPGDAELITVKGLRYLRQADVVLYDRLISPLLLDETRPEAELIFVGKEPSCHSMPQEQINNLLIGYARQGYTVVRLKGGDPFLFGRGGEEAQALVDASIPFEVVPGVSSVTAVPAYAGIPITHRNFTSSVTIVTGHEGYSTSPPVNWEALAALGGTLVVLMGVKALPHFTQRLIAAGMDSTLPAAVIQEGTTPQQRVITSTLADIAQRAQDAGLVSPALTIIGTVVSIRDALEWYEKAKAAHSTN
jgi:uroporphyrin-III C-methyltransferase